MLTFFFLFHHFILGKSSQIYMPPPPISLMLSLSLYLLCFLCVNLFLGASHVSAQFRGHFPFVCLHPGAHPIVGSGAPPAPGAPAEPPTAPHSPAPSGSQRSPSHLTKPGPATHGSRRRGPPWGPAGGPGESGWSLSVQRRRGRTIEVKPRKLGSHDGADSPQRAGRQVVPVSHEVFYFVKCCSGKSRQNVKVLNDC